METTGAPGGRAGSRVGPQRGLATLPSPSTGEKSHPPRPDTRHGESLTRPRGSPAHSPASAAFARSSRVGAYPNHVLPSPAPG